MTEIEFPKPFIELFTETIGMNNYEFKLFSSHFRETTIHKKDFFLKEGTISKQKAYIKKTLSDFEKWAKHAGFKTVDLIPLAGPASAVIAYK